MRNSEKQVLEIIGTGSNRNHAEFKTLSYRSRVPSAGLLRGWQQLTERRDDSSCGFRFR